MGAAVELDNCKVCGASDVSLTFPVRTDEPIKGAFSVKRCSNCGVGWTVPPVPVPDIKRWYPAAYYGEENVRFNSWLETLVRLLGRRRASSIARHSVPGPVLDIGCGRGCTLSALKGMGYEPYGVELSETAAWYVKHRLGISVHVGDFLTAPFSTGQFSAIIFWHSLEHLDRPVEAIRRAYELLQPGGLLVVAVPNSESFQASWFGAHWFHLDIPRHYYHFGTRGLHALLTGAGFHIKKTCHLSLEQSPYGWLQTMYNAMGIETNLLYSILKNPTARSMSIRTHRLQSIVTLAALPILLPMAILLTYVETACRRGGTIDVYATKSNAPKDQPSTMG